jgi:transposase-like protein
MLKITDVISELECYNKLRDMRWSDGKPVCQKCSSSNCKKVGKVTEESPNQHYQCEDCNRHFNDLTSTIFKSSNLPLKSWMCCLYLMGLNTSNRQIAQELGVSEKTAQNMTTKIRSEIQKNRPDPKLSGEVEFDEVYIVAGHKGHPESVKKGSKGPQETFKRGSRQRNAGKREAPYIGNDPTGWRGGYSYVGKCEANDD